MRLEFGEEPPAEICLPDKPLLEIEDDVLQRAIQDAPYITYRRYHLAHEHERPLVSILFNVGAECGAERVFLAGHFFFLLFAVGAASCFSSLSS